MPRRLRGAFRSNALNLIRIMPAEGLRAEPGIPLVPCLHPKLIGGIMLKIFSTIIASVIFASLAQAKETLTIYTYESFVTEWGPGGKVKEAFEKTCDCSIEWVGLGDGVAVLNRLKLEGANTKADLVLGLDTSLTAEAIGTGLFYGSATAIKMAGPSVLLAYMVAGIAIYIVMRALGEMAVHNPVSGSFSEYASNYMACKNYGPMYK